MCTPLSPIRFLFEDIKQVLCINTEEFSDAVKEITSNYATKPQIKIVCDPNVGLQDLAACWEIGTTQIRINECLLCALWASSYFIANAYISLCDYLNKQSQILPIFDDSIELLNYAKSLCPSYAEWSCELPVPLDFENDQYANLANLIVPIAADVIICHETAHMFLKHQKDGGLQQEVDADNLAVNWIIGTKKEPYPIKELSVMCAFITNIFLTLTPKKQGNCHPSAFDRLKNYLENLSIDDNDILWVIAILSYRAWEKEFEKDELIIPENTEMTYKASFYSLLYHE